MADNCVPMHKKYAATGDPSQYLDSAGQMGSNGKASDEIGLSHEAPARDGSTGREQGRGKIPGSESSRA